MPTLLSGLAAAVLSLPPVVAPPAVNESLMVDVPNFGPSRYETVSYCLKDAGVDKYQDLETDMEFHVFSACMTENT